MVLIDYYPWNKLNYIIIIEVYTVHIISQTPVIWFMQWFNQLIMIK